MKTILAIIVLSTVPVMSAPQQAVLGVFVTNASGDPIVKATVYFPDRPYTNVAAVTGREGLAHFGEIRTGTYRLCAMASGYAEHCADVAHVDAQAKTIVLTKTIQ